MDINYNKISTEGKSKPLSRNVKKSDEIIGVKDTVAIFDEESTREKISTPPKPIDYKVDRCTHLNLRLTPSKDSDVICILKLGDAIQVDTVSDGWAHAYTSAGVEGYVMEDFIKEV